MKLLAYYKNLLFELKPWIKTVTGWFIIGLIIGAITLLIKPEILSDILKVFEDKFGMDPALDRELSDAIFINNLRASAIALFGGIILGIIPFFIIITNGFLLGFIVASLFVYGTGFLDSLYILVVTIIPHGIIEIPAVLVAAALGLKLGIEWLEKANYGQRMHVLWQNIKKAFWGLVLISILLFIASLIEVFVTGKLAETVLK